MVVPQRNPVVRRASRETDDAVALLSAKTTAIETSVKPAAPANTVAVVVGIPLAILAAQERPNVLATQRPPFPPGEINDGGHADNLVCEHGVIAHVEDALVEEVNRRTCISSLKHALELGNLILETYFAGSAASFLAQNRFHVGFRSLSHRDDLLVSYRFLWYATHIAAQVGTIPESVAKLLPLSHHRLLVHVADPVARSELGSMAAEGGLSKRALGRLIANRALKPIDAVRQSRERGRPRLPAWAKVCAAVSRVVNRLETSQPTVADVVAMRRTDALQRLQDLTHAQSVLTRTGQLLAQCLELELPCDDAQRNDVGV